MIAPAESEQFRAASHFDSESVTTTAICAIISGIIFGASLIGLMLPRILPEQHLSKDTLDAIKLGTGMLSVLASLVLGLLVATAKTSYDTTASQVRAYSADLIVLDETLRDYGDGALPIRRMLRDYTSRLLNDVWLSGDHPYLTENRQAGDMMENIRNHIRDLPTSAPGQSWLVDQSLQIVTNLLRERWLLIEHAGPSVHPLVICLLVAWIVAIFISFGINAPRHATMIAAFFVVSMAIGSAMFLILEMDTPFVGVLRISSQPVETALTHMLPAGR